MVRDDEHAHPAAEDAQGVDGVEGLGAAGDFGDGEGAALCWADGADGEGDPVDLVFEDCCLDYCYYCARCQYIYIYIYLSVKLLGRLTKVPCCSGDIQTCPSLHRLRSLSSWTLGWECWTSSLTGRPAGS